MKNLLPLLCLLCTARLFATSAPDFTVTTSDNQTIQLYQNYINQGKLVVIEAFFTTCPPCGTHAPLVQNLYTQLQAQYPGKVEFILLSTLFSDTNVKVAQYKTDKGLTMPAAGADGNSQLALQPYTSGQFGPFQGTPTFIVVAPGSGEVTFDLRGNSASQTIDMVHQKVDELLADNTCHVYNFFGEPLTGASIHAYNGSFDTTFQVQPDGAYSLADIPQLQGQASVVRPAYDVNPLAGMTTYDLVLISKHILSIQPLLCDWQKLAADVNCNGQISTFDIVEARKVILGISQALPCGSYRFMPDSIVTSDASCQDFYGVKIGDVNADSCQQFGGGAVLSRTPLYVDMPDKTLHKGEHYQLTLKMEEDLDIAGMQAEIAYNHNLLTINDIHSDILPGFDENCYVSGRGNTVPLSWVFASGKHIPANTGFLTLDLVALDQVRLPEAIGLNDHAPRLAAQAYTPDNQIRNLVLRRQSGAVLVYPNPASGRFSVSATLPERQPCTLQLADAMGRIVFETTRDGLAGYNEWVLEPASLPAGVYFLRLNGAGVGKVCFRF